MTDKTQANDATMPQRATRPEAEPMPALPTHDAFEGAATQARPDETAQDDMPLTDHVDGPDPYADTQPRTDHVRQPFGEPHLKLQAPARPGYRRYWFNDEPGRIDRALKAGYSLVKVGGRNTRSVVGRAKNGGAQVAYLMEIPQAWFEQDMAAQQARVDEIDAAIKGGTINKDGGTATKDGDNRYIPKEGISYEPKRASR